MIQNLSQEELLNVVMDYIKHNYGYNHADVFEDTIQLYDEEDNVVNIYINVESES